MAGILKSLVASAAVAVGRSDLALRLAKSTSYARALYNERAGMVGEPPTPAAIYVAAARRMDGPEPMTFGTLPSGEPVRVRRELGLMSALILGATGAGKSRLLIALLLEPLRQIIDDLRLDAHWHADVGVELELIDPKFETFDLFRKYVAAMWLGANDAGRELLERSVRVIDWSHERVTPLTPFDNHFTEISNAYLAHLRADVSTRTSPQSYTDAMRQLLYMFDWLLIELRYPLSYRFAVRFMHDAGFRKGVLSHVPEPEVRYYFENFDLTVPRQTRDGFLRRVQYGTSFPELRASYIPPEAMDKLGLMKEAPITLVNAGPRLRTRRLAGHRRSLRRAAARSAPSEIIRARRSGPVHGRRERRSRRDASHGLAHLAEREHGHHPHGARFLERGAGERRANGASEHYLDRRVPGARGCADLLAACRGHP